MSTIMDDDPDDKDDSKRKSRNLSEKKRRDQFNLLVNELNSMVSSNNRKMDKSTVLKSTIAFLKSHNESTVRSRVHEIQTDWKPSFLSNEEFTHLILEALDGFIIVFSSTGRVFYASESITSLLGHLPSDLLNMTVYDMVYEDDQNDLYNILLNPTVVVDPLQTGIARENQVTFSCYIKRGTTDYRFEVSYELVQFTGYFRSDVDADSLMTASRFSSYMTDADTRLIFVGTGRLQTPQLIREMSIVDSSKSEFTSRQSLEWKFLYLDHQAPLIIGYLPFEVLGTCGYDYYHFDDLDKVVACHEALMQKGEGTSCYYRFLTKGQQWIWLQTRYYITYHQWHSKPEFIVCTHRVVSYADVMKQTRNQVGGDNRFSDDADSVSVGVERKFQPSSTQSLLATSPWSSKSSRTTRVAATPGASPSGVSLRGRHRYNTYYGPGSDSATSISTESHASRQSMQTHHSSKSRMRSNTYNSKTSSQHSQEEMQHQPAPLLLQQPTIQNTPQQQMGQFQPMLSAPPHHQQQQQHQTRPPVPTTIIKPPVPQLIGSAGFIEPQQYLAAIPVQPVAGFPPEGTAGVLSPIPPTSPAAFAVHPNVSTGTGGVVLTPAQNQVQGHLQRKHEELQHLIMQQQEELRRVQEQLLMARYGLLPSIVTLPFSSAAAAAAAANNNEIHNRCNNSASYLQHHQLPHSSHQYPTHPSLISQPQNLLHPHQHHQQQQQQQHHQQQPQQQQQQQSQQQQQMCIPPDQKPIFHSNQQLNFTDTGQSKLLVEPGNEMISYMQLTPVPIHHLQQQQQQQQQQQPSQSSQQQSQHQQQQQQQMHMSSDGCSIMQAGGGGGTGGANIRGANVNSMELLQYQMGQEQAQILFTSGMEQQQHQHPQQPQPHQQQNQHHLHQQQQQQTHEHQQQQQHHHQQQQQQHQQQQLLHQPQSQHPGSSLASPGGSTSHSRSDM
ncbi:circadian locomoter output cycles protein kaput [Sabethes cyaneus]|uniref:circadian locomoter output cycles protein kaput n=1 Tax=Sabethes cyaneus TaxID=53552 RepID=UPI00237EA6F1|nr:circadian locomoter output cycles protein kaput [Sabethes cyaneus]